MKRRDFLKATAVGGAAAATVTMKARRASAVPLFGDVPADKASIMLPQANQATSILECFMYGGVTPWEGFYCVPSYGASSKTWHNAYPADFAMAAQACGYDTTNPFTPFALESAEDGKTQQMIHLSPYLRPLIARTDITDRMRVVVNRHTLEPHEAAIPLAMSGKTLGSPSLASLGSHVARYFVDHDIDNQHPSPFSYGFSISNSFVPTDNILTMLATGLHPGAARPLHIKINDASRLSYLLNRTPIGSLDDRARYDALISAYFQQYNQRLKFPGSAELLRAPRLGELTAAASALAHAADIQSLLSSDYLAKINGQACFNRTGAQSVGSSGFDPSSPFTNASTGANYPGMSLKMATHLLTHPQFPAKHCMVIDTGLREADGGGGYDTHNETPFTQAHNLNNFFNSLLPLINAPGETDPTKLDLNKTMIILNMEFGRTPGIQIGKSNTGRNHWPYGYTQVYIGGPITTAQKGIYGRIDESGQATTFTSPTENRIAALLAMGIYPFDQASFSSANVTVDGADAGSEAIAIQSVLKRVLGYTV